MLHPRSAAGSAALYFLSGAALAQPAPSQPDTGEVTLPEVTVSAPRVSVRGYLVPETSTALKVPTPIQDVPISVQVVPGDLITDRGALTTSQAIETVSGVESSTAIPGSLAVRIRGFADGSANLRDGFRDTSNQGDIQGIERIEVLKGPASVLYGGNLSSGGVVNVVTRSPVEGTFGRIGGAVGSYGLYRSTLDLNAGDVTGDGTLGVRLNTALERSNSVRRFGQSDTEFINPSIRWRPTAQDEVVIRAQFLRGTFSYGPFQSPIAQRVLSLPLSFNFDDPNQGESRREAARISYNWVHTFSENLRFRSGFNASGVNYSFGTDRFAVLRLLADGRNVQRAAGFGPVQTRDYDLQNELSGTFRTGSVRHDWLVGAESYWSANTLQGFQATLPNLDLLNPVYGVAIGPSRLTTSTRATFIDHAGYVQDFVTLSPGLRILLGGRYDSTETSSRNRLTNVDGTNSASRFSPRVGVVYEPAPTTALYANWANSFIPTTATTAAGAALPPSEAEQYEVGVKQQFFDKKLQATAALFQITRTNVPTRDPSNTLFSIASGQQQSRGLELDVAGELRPGWKVAAGYAYTFADVTRDSRLPVGNVLAGVARHAGTLWTSYELPEGSILPGFGVGLGVRAETKRDATLPNTFKLPGYIRLDAAAWYRFQVAGKPVRAQVNVQNLTDARIYNTDGSTALRPTAPLSVLGALTADF